MPTSSCSAMYVCASLNSTSGMLLTLAAHSSNPRPVQHKLDILRLAASAPGNFSSCCVTNAKVWIWVSYELQPRFLEQGQNSADFCVTALGPRPTALKVSHPRMSAAAASCTAACRGKRRRQCSLCAASRRRKRVCCTRYARPHC